MRMIVNPGTLTETIYEGTPEELASFRRALDSSGGMTIAPDRPTGATPGRQFVTEDIAYRALTRIRLSPEQREVIATIHQAHPEWVWADDLQHKIGYSASAFAGLMGAFGRRLTHTPGYVAHSYFFDNHWDATRACNRYRLPDSVRAAVEKAGLDRPS